ncbi:receptor-type tyrosine-protein phosphatase eta isoform X2 [Sander vitreus]
MGKRSLQDKVLILLSWALVLLCSAAEQDYFPRSKTSTWDEARTHCQVCFKELVTLTPQNIQHLSQNLTSDYWIGLRKYFYCTGNRSMSWSRWANGDPLIFQNWYPGSPRFKSSTKPCSCSCSCTNTSNTTPGNFTPSGVTNMTDMSNFTNITNQTVTDFNRLWNATTRNTPPTATPRMPEKAECVQSPMVSLLVSETDVNYIEDSCVAMLSFGAWVEKNCSELLPYICYDDRFLGQVNVTNKTSESAFLTWQPGPGNISYYRIEVKVDKNLTEFMTSNLTHDLVNLTAGTGYTVQVFPVKCERELNPQKVTFYTKPNKVENLTVINVAETSVFLRWDKPVGNLDFYLIKVQDGQKIRSDTKNKEVGSLISGNLYTFTVHSVVNDTLSEGYNTSTYTKPGKVLELMVSNNSPKSLLLSWKRPEGQFTGFFGKATYDDNVETVYTEWNVTKWNVTGLPIGTKITVSVTALTNGTLKGEEETIVTYTAPEPVSDLNLVATDSSLNATWTSSGSNSFTLELYLDDQKGTYNSTLPTWLFEGLKTAANYTVKVYAVSGNLKSSPVERSCFTKPLQPTNAKIKSCDKNQITIEWDPPKNIAPTAMYFLNINSSFWSYNMSLTTCNTIYKFDGLKSGTRYDFEVRTMAGNEKSDPAVVSSYTVAEKREISLSMLCSSAVPLLCDNATTRERVFQQLRAHFNRLLKDSVFWTLEKH